MVSKRILSGLGGSVLPLAMVVGSFLPLCTPQPARAEEPVCFECHDDFPDTMAAFAHKHPPAEEGDCTACHLDHGDEERLMLAREGAALCGECHDDVAAGATVHSPVGDGECTECHDPHGSKNAKLLAATGNELCFTCHDEGEFTRKVAHAALDDGCTGCHDPHSSKNAKLLAAAGDQQCFACHDEGEFSGTVTHAALDDGCTGCHNPHSSESGKLLATGGEELCFTCHDRKPEFSGKVTHAALDDGCTGCHQPHASGNQYLLAKNFATDRILLFDPKQAELCFECHDLETFTKSQSEDTGFRTGTRNLHALHLNGGAAPNKYGIVKKKEGQTCFACHLPHTADQDRLLRTEYQCTGTFCYTMRYIQNERGGTCIVGCHKPKAYARDGQVPAPTAGPRPAN